jgi:hypothetical protein
VWAVLTAVFLPEQGDSPRPAGPGGTEQRGSPPTVEVLTLW